MITINVNTFVFGFISCIVIEFIVIIVAGIVIGLKKK